jgi:DNA-directed RNA polymerase subunit RPC12/RpoP
MTISFHCEHCGKKIEAPDSAGGKSGKCPACRIKVNVPSLDTDEELRLAPLDEKALAEQRRLMDETRQVEQEILSETVVPEGLVEPGIDSLVPDTSEKELTKNIIVYLRQMADGELDQAERLSNAIVPHGNRALKILEKIALSEIPEPELADIPQQVLSGLIRTLRNRIG